MAESVGVAEESKLVVSPAASLEPPAGRKRLPRGCFYGPAEAVPLTVVREWSYAGESFGFVEFIRAEERFARPCW